MANHNRVRGNTLVEATIVLVITSFLITIMANLVTSSGDSQAYTQRMTRATEVSQEVANDIRQDLLSTVTMFEDDSFGNGYFGAFQLDPASPPLATTKLAKAVVTGPFAKEATAGERTGNAIAFAVQAWTTQYEAGSGTKYIIDVYRFFSYYLSKTGSGPQPGSPGGLTLAKFISEPVADGEQLDAVTNLADRTQVLQHLMGVYPDIHGKMHPKVKLLWRRGEEITGLGTLREIDVNDFSISNVPVPPRPSGAWQIHADPNRSVADLLEFRKFSIASNYAEKRMRVGLFSVKNNTGDGFPHGFEVQLGGPPSGRQVMLDISVVGTNRKGTKAHATVRATVMVEDM